MSNDPLSFKSEIPIGGRVPTESGAIEQDPTPTVDSSSDSSESPELLAGKYKNREELLKAVAHTDYGKLTDEELVELYKGKQQAFHGNTEESTETPEVEKELGVSEDTPNAEENAEEATPEAPEETPNNEETPEADEAGEFNLQTFTDIYAEQGEFNETQYAELEKAGFPKEYVDTYIEGQKAKFQLDLMTASEVAGGKDSLDTMQTWAKANLTEAEIVAYNNGVRSGDSQKISDAVTLLKTKYSAKNPTQHVVGNTTAQITGEFFSSDVEMTTAMNDPRYAKDPAYRSKVEQKIANGMRLGKL